VFCQITPSFAAGQHIIASPQLRRADSREIVVGTTGLRRWTSFG
jgi:hypothetical protein